MKNMMNAIGSVAFVVRSAFLQRQLSKLSPHMLLSVTNGAEDANLRWLHEYWSHLHSGVGAKYRKELLRGRNMAYSTKRRKQSTSQYLDDLRKKLDRRTWVALMNDVNECNLKGKSFADTAKGLLGLKQLFHTEL